MRLMLGAGKSVRERAPWPRSLRLAVGFRPLQARAVLGSRGLKRRGVQKRRRRAAWKFCSRPLERARYDLLRKV